MLGRKKIKLFDYQQIKKITQVESQLMRGLLEVLPRLGFDASLRDSLLSALNPYLGENFSLNFRGLTTTHESPFQKDKGLEEIYVVIGMSPLPHKALIKIDPLLAFVMIDLILGGDGKSQIDRVLPTEAEQGVLSYLVLKLLDHVYKNCGAGNQVHFRFEGFRFKSQEIKDLIPDTQALVFLHFETKVADKVGMIQVILPDPFVTQGFLQPFAQLSPTTMEEAMQKLRWDSVGHIHAPMWAEIGEVSLSLGELSDLSTGDVVLFDENSVRFENGHVGGSATIHFGQGDHVAVHANIVDDQPKLKLKLESMSQTG